MRVEFTVPGACQAKQRPRINKNTGRVYTPGATHKYEKLVRECYKEKGIYYFDDEYISIKIIFKFEIPKSYNRKKHSEALEGIIRPTRADIDNYIKSVLDGLNGTAFKDDRYIVGIEAEKIFAEESETIIRIESGE